MMMTVKIGAEGLCQPDEHKHGDRTEKHHEFLDQGGLHRISPLESGSNH
jgi:hypothetical protein